MVWCWGVERRGPSQSLSYVSHWVWLHAPCPPLLFRLPKPSPGAHYLPTPITSPGLWPLLSPPSFPYFLSGEMMKGTPPMADTASTPHCSGNDLERGSVTIVLESDPNCVLWIAALNFFFKGTEKYLTLTARILLLCVWLSVGKMKSVRSN